MFHHNKNNTDNSSSSSNKKGLSGLFHHNKSSSTTSSTSTSTTYPVGTGYQQHGSTASDWDHYAVRHEEALIGDPIPIVDNNLNLAANRSQLDSNLHNNLGSSGNLNSSGKSSSKSSNLPSGYDKNGNPLIGPVTANGPLAGNYSSGTVVEKNLARGPGKRTNTGANDDYLAANGQTWGSAAWGSEPLYGGRTSAPLYGYRDQRDVATPLLPDNPWTHNELGRDYLDAYRNGSLPYSSINNVFVAPPVTESFHNVGPNGEIIDGTVTRQVREEIVPPIGGLGTNTTASTTTTVKEKIIPVDEVIIASSSIPIPPPLPSTDFSRNASQNIDIVDTGASSIPIPPPMPASDFNRNAPLAQPIEVIEVTETFNSTSISDSSLSGSGSSSNYQASNLDSKIPPMSWYNSSSNLNQTKAI